MATAGYSGTPLIKKLGFKPEAKVLLIEAPEHYAELLGPEASGISFVGKAKGKLDAVHAFCTSKAALVKLMPSMRSSIVPQGMIWISWPKKAAKVTTDITEDVVREIALKNSLVDVKVCAIDEKWSGLKLLIRLKDR